MAFYFERDSFYHIYKDCPDIDTNLKEEKIVGTGEKEVCLKCAERKKVEFLKRKELDNKNEYSNNLSIYLICNILIN